MSVRRLAILGSTGSIGRQTLDLVDRFPDQFTVDVLVAGSNISRLTAQIDKYRPKFVSVSQAEDCEKIGKEFPGLEVDFGVQGAERGARWASADLIVMGIVGFAALKPMVSAIRSGKTIALANKESLVVGGSVLKKEISQSQCKILPVDSEHNAIFQLLEGRDREDIDLIILTASGGPLLRLPELSLEEVTPAIALKHPNWVMGPKISVDSATLMNKGLEVIEAHYLFDFPAEKIEVWIHPQSIVHGALTLKDNGIIAHMSRPDMHGPIGYAMKYPERLSAAMPRCTFKDLAHLEFMQPDEVRFPALKYAKQALMSSPAHCIALNAANEIAVESFLEGRINFAQIPQLVARVLDKVKSHAPSHLEEVFFDDGEYREAARRELKLLPLSH